MNVLVVEGDSLFRKHLSHRLTAEGFNVLEAKSTQEALELACENEVRTIVLDLHAPREEALDFLENVRNKCPEARVVLINRTGDISLSIAAMKLGAFDEVTAPVDIDALAAKLKLTRVQTRKP